MVIVIKEKMIRFMQGRYGADQFSKVFIIDNNGFYGFISTYRETIFLYDCN